MKATKYKKVKELPEGAMSVAKYAEEIGQQNPPYICVAYDRYLSNPEKYAKPAYYIVNWQGFNFVIPN